MFESHLGIHNRWLSDPQKWLSYREKNVLGRGITKDEAREFTHMVRRIAALILMEQCLDANYASMNDHSYVCPHTDPVTQEIRNA